MQDVQEDPLENGMATHSSIIGNTKIMASGPITSWQIDGERVMNFIFGAPKSLQMMTAIMN